MTASNGNDKKMQVRLDRLFVLILVLLFATVSCAKKKVSSGAPGDGTSASETSDEAFELAKQREMERRKAIEEGRLSETQGEQGTMEGETGAATDMEQFVNEIINFEYDSSFLTPAAQEVLRRKADWLRANPDANVVVQGHTDERGTVEYNLALGDRRANSAKSFLVDMGIDGARITTVSFGEERPIDPMNTEDAWAQNRRAEFVLEQ